MLTKKYPSTTRIVGIVLRSYIPNSGKQPTASQLLSIIVGYMSLSGQNL